MRAKEFIFEQPVEEGIKQNAVMAALIAALSTPAKADYNYPNTQPEASTAAQALTIIRKINKMKDYGSAGLEGEATQEFNNLMRSIQGHPNQSKLYPLIKDLIKSPDTEQLPPLQGPVNERKKSKKKKSKRGYPVAGYYGYYWGGHNDSSDSAGDAGGGGDGGGESMYESQAQLDPAVKQFLNGLTPDDVGVDNVGMFRVHYEGFTDQCQDTDDYRNSPEKVFTEVWSDFIKREGGARPVGYGITGTDDYPIVYAVFKK